MTTTIEPSCARAVSSTDTYERVPSQGPFAAVDCLNCGGTANGAGRRRKPALASALAGRRVRSSSVLSA
jgi:hypothetical protein